MAVIMHSFLQSPMGLFARFLVGCLLIWLGTWALPLSSVKESAPNFDRPSENVTSQEAPRYRLTHNHEEDAWMVTPLGGASRQLTNIIPRARQTQIKGGYLDRDEIRVALLACLAEWRLKLSAVERHELLALRLGSGQLFELSDLMADAVSPTQVPPLSGPWNWLIPARLNPTSVDFNRNMLAWRKVLLGQLLAAAKKKGKINFNVADAGGLMVRLPLGPSARARITSSKFGDQGRDAALFLQFLALKRGAELEVDGVFGAGSRLALAKLLEVDQVPASHRQVYLLFLENYFSKATPTLLDPSSQGFKRYQLAWANWVRPLLMDDSFTHQGSLFRLSSQARSRILADNFGSVLKDELIFLQFLANHFGYQIKIDGNFGPHSRKTLQAVYKDQFHRRNLNDYRNLLQTRYR